MLHLAATWEEPPAKGTGGLNACPPKTRLEKLGNHFTLFFKVFFFLIKISAVTATPIPGKS